MEIEKFIAAKGEMQKELFDRANKVRCENVGTNVYFRGIIEFTNICEKDCFYCGIRKSNKNAERFSMSMDEIKECLSFINSVEYGSVVLQSGELTTSKAKKFLLNIVQFINKNYPEMGITLSCGELDKDFLRELKNAGAHRYLLRIETSVPSLYAKIHPADHSFERRLQCLQDLKDLGYQVGSGNMIGIPSQTVDDLVADLEFFQKNDFDMFGLGPYVIHEDTPLASEENKKWWNENKENIFNMALNFIALLRILMPTCNIAAATALDVFSSQGRVDALKAGANVIMPSVTPKEYRKKYLLYQNKPCIDEDAEKCSKCIVNKVRFAGLEPKLGVRGDAEHYQLRKKN